MRPVAPQVCIARMDGRIDGHAKFCCYCLVIQSVSQVGYLGSSTEVPTVLHYTVLEDLA